MNPLRRLKERIYSYETNSPTIESPEYNYRLLEYGGLVMSRFTLKNSLKLLSFCLIFSSCSYGCLGHLLHYLSDNSFNYYYVADDVAIMLSTYVGTSAAVYLSVRLPLVRQVERNLLITTNPDYGKPPNVEMFIKSLNHMLVPYSVVFFAVCAILSSTYFVFRKCPPEETTCGLLFNAYLFFVDLEKQPWRGIYCTLQILPSFYGGLGIFNQILILVSINELIITHINHLNNMLLSISKLPNRSQRRIMIGRCVRYHLFILTNADFIRDKIAYLYLIHLILGPTLLSVISYQMMEIAATFPSFFHLCVYLVLISVNCISGERLYAAGLTVREVAYKSIPLDGDIETMKDLKLIIIRSSKPMVITAGKFTIVGHVLLGNILKTTSSVMALLHQM